MELKITQCSIGKFNLCSKDESLSFYMGIYDNGKIVEENGVRAQLVFSGDVDNLDLFNGLYDDFNGIEEVYEKCIEYSDKVWSSTDYLGQCLLFYKIYKNNYESINNAFIEKRKERLTKQLKDIEEDLARSIGLSNIDGMANAFIDKKIAMYTKWINKNKEEIAQLKEGSIKSKELLLENEKYQLKISELESKKQ